MFPLRSKGRLLIRGFIHENGERLVFYICISSSRRCYVTWMRMRFLATNAISLVYSVFPEGDYFHVASNCDGGIYFERVHWQNDHFNYILGLYNVRPSINVFKIYIYIYISRFKNVDLYDSLCESAMSFNFLKLL